MTEIVDERQRLVAALVPDITGPDDKGRVWLHFRSGGMRAGISFDAKSGIVAQCVRAWRDDIINALASPSEGNKKGDDNGREEWLRLGQERLRANASHPQEQPRKATGEAVAWRVKDFADGWILFHTIVAASGYAREHGALLQPLYLSVSPAAAEGWQVITEIAAERQRQRTVEGWTDEHDDGHRNGSLASAAAAYALRGADRPLAASDAWPVSWDRKWFKPKDRRRDLIRAGALIVAEIERRDRAAAPPSPAAQEQEE